MHSLPSKKDGYSQMLSWYTYSFIFSCNLLQSYHPNRDDQVITIEDAEFVRHADDGAGAELQGAFVDHIEDAGQAFVRRDVLFNLQRTELAITLQDHVDLLGIPVALEVEIGLQACILIALHGL